MMDRKQIRRVLRAGVGAVACGGVLAMVFAWLDSSPMPQADDKCEEPISGIKTQGLDPAQPIAVPIAANPASASPVATLIATSLEELRTTLLARIDFALTDVRARRATPTPPSDRSDPKQAVRDSMERALRCEVLETQLEELKEDAVAAEALVRLQELIAKCDQLVAHLKE